MPENNALVNKAGQLRSRQQQLLSTIMKLQDGALLVNEQVVIVQARVEMLVKESQGVFVNGPTLIETTKKII